jgi:hypothetical protein
LSAALRGDVKRWASSNVPAILALDHPVEVKACLNFDFHVTLA